MAHGAVTVFDVVIASGASTSNEVNLGRGWRRVLLDPTGAAAACNFQAAANALGVSGTYRRVYYPAAAAGTDTAALVTSAVSGGLIEVPLAGFQFVKVVLTGTVANGATLKLICADL